MDGLDDWKEAPALIAILNASEKPEPISTKTRFVESLKTQRRDPRQGSVGT